MKNKIVFLIIPIAVTILVLSGYSTILAQSPAAGTNSATQNTTPVISDYAKDVQDGEQAIANDFDAQNNQKHVKENEGIEGKEEIEAVETQEAIEPQEAVEPKEVEDETENEGGKSDSKSEGESDNGSKQNGDSQQSGSNNPDKENKSTSGD